MIIFYLNSIFFVCYCYYHHHHHHHNRYYYDFVYCNNVFVCETLCAISGPPFAFRIASILHDIASTRFWKHSSVILVHIDTIASYSYCRFVGCTTMTRISHSTTSQMCSIGLRSGDCGGHLSTVNSLSCSCNQFEMI